jgi:leukotriene-A4 hydrolase
VRIHLFFVATHFNISTPPALTALFLDQLKSYKPLPSTHISHLGSLYKFTPSQNAEIRSRFYKLALADPNATAARVFAPDAANWIVGADGSGIVKGRMKFCRPILKGVFKVDKQLAVDAFSKHKNLFHPIARKLIEKVMVHPLSVVIFS